MKQFESRSYLMHIYDNCLIEFRIKRNMTLQASDVWASRDQSLAYLKGKSFLVLLEGEKNAGVSGDARRAGASAEYAEHVSALAVLCPRTYDKIMGSLFLKVNKPVVPIRLFDERREALAWLRSQAPQPF